MLCRPVARSCRRGGCAVKAAGKERYDEKKRRNQSEKAVRQRRQGLERLRSAIPRYALYAAVMGAIAVAAVWMWSRPSLPPTTMAGHTEELPGGYVLSTPMPEAIQRHMLEQIGRASCRERVCQYV